MSAWSSQRASVAAFGAGSMPARFANATSSAHVHREIGTPSSRAASSAFWKNQAFCSGV
jgi:hypothetical protein